MLVEATVEYVAGGWPGFRHAGKTKVSFNIEDDASVTEKEAMAVERAKEKVGRETSMKPSDVRIIHVELEGIAGCM